MLSGGGSVGTGPHQALTQACSHLVAFLEVPVLLLLTMPGSESELSHIWCQWAGREYDAFTGHVVTSKDLRGEREGVEWALIGEPPEDEAHWASLLRQDKLPTSLSFQLLPCGMGVLVDDSLSWVSKH